MANRLRWIAVVAIFVGWFLIRSEDDSLAVRVVLLIVAFGMTSALVLWRPPERGIFRERHLSARALKVFVPAEPCLRDPFVVRRRYRVKGPPKGGPQTSIRQGQVLCYIGQAYVAYDCLTSFNFLDEEGETVFWALADNEPVETWRNVFDELVQSEKA